MFAAIAAVLAILAFAFGLYVFTGAKSRLTPFMSVVILADITILFSLVGMLRPGAFAAYGLSLAVFAAALYKSRNNIKEKTADFFSAGVVMFVVSCGVMLYILYSTQPVFHDWDEFSFWGMSRKILNKFDRLYTYHNTSMLGQSIPPAMPVLTYFFGLFNPQFSEWLCYFAYDVLFLSAFCAFTATSGKKQGYVSVFTFITAAMLPFVFEITEISSKLSGAYISLYSDMPLGFVFAGCVAVYLAWDKNDAVGIGRLIPGLIFLTFIKDMGLALSCIVVFVVFFDMVIEKNNYTFAFLKGFFAKCAAAFTMLAVTVATYISWSIHISKVLQLDRSQFSETASVSMAGMLISGVKELFSPVKSEKFAAIFNSMISAFFETKISMLGSGLRIVLVITAVFALAFFAADRKGKKRVSLAYITSFTGFIGYYVFHLFLYVYVFKNDAYTLPSYGRYMYIYYMGWLCIGFVYLTIYICKSNKIYSAVFMLALSVTFVGIVGFYTTDGNLFISANSNSYHKRTLVDEKADYLSDVINPEDVIYIVSEDNAGENWFMYSYALLDNRIVKDNVAFGQDSDPEKDMEIALEMKEYFRKNGVTHLLVDNISAVVCRRYDRFFDASIGDTAFDRVGYYRVNYTDDGFYFRQLKWGRTG